MDPLKMSVGGGEVARPESQPGRVERPEAVVQAPKPEEGHQEEGREEARSDQGDSRRGGPGLDGNVVTYAVDQKTREVVAKVVDRSSGEVVREVPSEQLRAMQKALREANKQLFDRMA